MSEEKKEGKGANNFPLGFLIGVIAAGLPIWIYAEKKVEERTTTNNKVSTLTAQIDSLKGELSQLRNSVRADIDRAEATAKSDLGSAVATLHQRVSALDSTMDEKFQMTADHAVEARKTLDGRIWTTEQDIKRLDKEVAIMQAKPH